MPGPMNGIVRDKHGRWIRSYHRHAECRNKERCTGWGCVIRTGKTKRARISK